MQQFNKCTYMVILSRNYTSDTIFLVQGFEYPLLVAVSNVVRFKNWNEPLQAHLALTGDPTEMV